MKTLAREISFLNFFLKTLLASWENTINLVGYILIIKFNMLDYF